MTYESMFDTLAALALQPKLRGNYCR